jgi:chitooligosaccharide deacetylase
MVALESHATPSLRPRVARAVRTSRYWPTFPPKRVKDLYPLGWSPPREVVALTFDDGPDPEATYPILRLLARHDSPATFFMCGVAARRYPSIVKAVADEGHTVAGHTWDHQILTRAAPSDWEAEITAANDLLSELSGTQIVYFRPPRGEYTSALIRWLVARQLIPVLWSGHGRDWSETRPEVIAASVAASLEPNAIVLLHDGCGDRLTPEGVLPPDVHGDPTRTVAAVPRILRDVREYGLTPVALPRQAPVTPTGLSRRARFVPR